MQKEEQVGKGAVGKQKISLDWEVSSLKACGTPIMRCPLRWIGEAILPRENLEREKRSKI